MGEAKQRGTKAERLAQAAEANRHKAEAAGWGQRDLNEVRLELGLPLDAPFHGYAVHIPERDEFLVQVKDSQLSTTRSWARAPALAHLFADFSDAYALARGGRGEIVVGVFETATQYFVAEVL